MEWGSIEYYEISIIMALGISLTDYFGREFFGEGKEVGRGGGGAELLSERNCSAL